MKPVIPLTKGHVINFIRYCASTHGKASDTKLPRGLVDACIREGAMAAEAAIGKIVDDAFAPAAMPVNHHAEIITGILHGTEDATNDMILARSWAVQPNFSVTPEPMTACEAAVALGGETFPDVDPLAWSGMCPNGIAPQFEAEPAVGDAVVDEVDESAPFEIEVATPEPAPVVDPVGIADDEGFESVFDASITPLDAFIAQHELRLIAPKSHTGEWYCCRGDIGDDVLNNKPAAIAAMRQHIITMGDCRASAVEAYASTNGLEIEA